MRDEDLPAIESYICASCKKPEDIALEKALEAMKQPIPVKFETPSKIHGRSRTSSYKGKLIAMALEAIKESVKLPNIVAFSIAERAFEIHQEMS